MALRVAEIRGYCERFLAPSCMHALLYRRTVLSTLALVADYGLLRMSVVDIPNTRKCPALQRAESQLWVSSGGALNCTYLVNLQQPPLFDDMGAGA